VQARSSGQQVLVSTSTKALQDQLVRDLDKLLEPFLPFDFRYTVLKGRKTISVSPLVDGISGSFFLTRPVKHLF